MEEFETNDSEAQHGDFCEISRELLSENLEKKEKIFRIKVNFFFF